MTFWKSPAFKDLQRAWYEVLESTGFKDAEEVVGEELVLKHTAAYAYHGLSAICLRNKEAYFYFIAQKVQETIFENDIDRLILVNYAEGKKIKSICEELRKIGKWKARNTVRFRIRNYEIQWGLKQYKPNQLNQYPRKVS